MEDYGIIYGYISQEIYPPSFNKADKRELRRKAAKYTTNDGFLYYNNRRCIASKDEIKKIFESLHCDKTAGHFGRDKTREKICSRYYWLGMVEEIDTFVSTCDTCQRSNKKFNKL